MQAGPIHSGWDTSVPVPEESIIDCVGSGFPSTEQTLLDAEHAEQSVWPQQLSNYEFPAEFRAVPSTSEPWNQSWICVREYLEAGQGFNSHHIVPVDYEQPGLLSGPELGLSHGPQAPSHALSDPGDTSGIHANFSGLNNPEGLSNLEPPLESQCHTGERVSNDARSTLIQNRSESIRPSEYPCSYCDVYAARTLSQLMYGIHQNDPDVILDRPLTSLPQET